MNNQHATENTKRVTAPSDMELQKMTIEGEIPNWLQGKLIRNGPALFDLREQSMRHWFDGYGMLHGFVFEKGDAYYQSRYVQSEEYLNSTASGKVSTVAWGTASDPCRSIFRRFMANFSAIPTNTNVNVVKIGSKYFATSDIATITEFDSRSLETLSSFAPTKRGVMAAHPSYTADGRVWNMTSAFGPVVKNTFIAIDDKPSTDVKLSYMTKRLFYTHSFGSNERYLVAIEQPMQLDFVKLMTSGPKNKSFYECFEWNESAKNVFHIYDREVNTYRAIASDLQFFFFHTINTHEADGKLYIDLCGYADNKIVDDFYLDNLADKGIADMHKATIRRITIDMDEPSVVEVDYGYNLELPNINDAYRSQQYQYVYGVHSPKGNNKLAVNTVKYSMLDKKPVVWGENGCGVGEPIFVARPDAQDEDDGVVIVLCSSDADNTSKLVVLDAKTMTKIASADVPQHIPPALHGWFYS